MHLQPNGVATCFATSPALCVFQRMPASLVLSTAVTKVLDVHGVRTSFLDFLATYFIDTHTHVLILVCIGAPALTQRITGTANKW